MKFCVEAFFFFRHLCAPELEQPGGNAWRDAHQVNINAAAAGEHPAGIGDGELRRLAIVYHHQHTFPLRLWL